MSPPTYTPPVDPNLEAQQKQAEQDKTLALQGVLRGDTAKTMMRYGTNVALSGASLGSPLGGA